MPYPRKGATGSLGGGACEGCVLEKDLKEGYEEP